MNPGILLAIIIQSLIAKTDRMTGAIAGYVITTGILIWGLNAYSEGGYIIFIGIELSQSAFIIACIVWYFFDTSEFLKAKRTGEIAAIPKAPLSSLDSPERFLGQKAFDATTQDYIGKLSSVKIDEGKCVIKPNLVDEISKNLTEVLVMVDEAKFGVKPTEAFETDTINGTTKERLITCPQCNQSEHIPENELFGISLYTKFDAEVKSRFGFQTLYLRCRNCSTNFTIE